MASVLRYVTPDFTRCQVMVIVVFRVTVLPFFGNIVTAIVQRPSRTARMLVLEKAQNRVPLIILIRNLP
jgi:hypothetical protein